MPQPVIDAFHPRFCSQPEQLFRVRFSVFPNFALAQREGPQPSFGYWVQWDHPVWLRPYFLTLDVYDAVVPNQRIPSQRRSFNAFPMKFSGAQPLKPAEHKTRYQINVSFESSQKESLHFVRRINLNRSEERRVGKECRSRWSTYH